MKASVLTGLALVVLASGCDEHRSFGDMPSTFRGTAQEVVDACNTHGGVNAYNNPLLDTGVPSEIPIGAPKVSNGSLDLFGGSGRTGPMFYIRCKDGLYFLDCGQTERVDRAQPQAYTMTYCDGKGRSLK